MNLRSICLFLASACIVLGAPPANAGGDKALADQVATLTTQLAALTTQMAAVTARLGVLEGQITAADLVGTYAIHGIQNEMSAPSSPGGFPTQISSYIFVGTVTLNADGSASISAGPDSGNTLFIGPPASVQAFQGSGGGSGTGTWTYANGAVTVSGGAPALSVAAGGRVLVGASTNHTDGTDVLLILTRLQ